MTYTATESDTLYIFFDNQHDEFESKSIDVDIRLQNPLPPFGLCPVDELSLFFVVCW